MQRFQKRVESSEIFSWPLDELLMFPEFGGHQPVEQAPRKLRCSGGWIHYETGWTAG